MSYEHEHAKYVLNLIDTPGHSDFSYEVSRALAAVEGAILLIDGTKGIQAQTLSNLRAAQKAGLTIIPAVNKIDLAASHIETSSRRPPSSWAFPKKAFSGSRQRRARAPRNFGCRRATGAAAG